ncbi:MAG: hypothetical protein DME33_07465 [Verrucomicrobia bacterium]|nr:MAG: hypothetical protein DME33_07465 [Verrucomicrobiota bacterium]
MKPTFPIISSARGKSFDGGKRKSRRSPVTDYNYHSVAFEGSHARYASPRARSFWNLTGDYLKNEARYDFWAGSIALGDPYAHGISSLDQ